MLACELGAGPPGRRREIGRRQETHFTFLLRKYYFTRVVCTHVYVRSRSAPPPQPPADPESERKRSTTCNEQQKKKAHELSRRKMYYGQKKEKLEERRELEGAGMLHDFHVEMLINHHSHVLDIIRKKKIFGFYESFILFTKSAIFNCDSVFFFVHFRES
jgi:hypothetical protein